MGQGGCPPPREEEWKSCATTPSWHPGWAGRGAQAGNEAPSLFSSPTSAHKPARPREVMLVFHS